MLTVDNISKKFGNFYALKNVSAQFNAGDSVALLGPNGSGKTTLIKSILGLVVPTAGTVQLYGKAVTQNQLKNITGYMPQIGRYPENMSVKSLLAMMLDIRGKKLNQCDTDLYEGFQMDRIAHKKLGALSGGTKQKVGAVLAFLFHPQMVILDEPTAGLDPYSSSLLKDKIRAFSADDKLVMITSHIIGELDGLVSEVMYLIEGKLHFYRTVGEIKDQTHETTLEKALAHVMTTDEELRLSYADF